MPGTAWFAKELRLADGRSRGYESKKPPREVNTMGSATLLNTLIDTPRCVPDLRGTHLDSWYVILASVFQARLLG